jgi:cytochrome subunit of sulfide dehydrogenase
MRLFFKLIAVVTFVMVANAGVTHADQVSSRILANTCFSCHGHKGKSLGAMPSIKGKPAKYIQTMLNAFRDDKRKGTVMNRIAKGFTPDEIKSLSQYFSSLK